MVSKVGSLCNGPLLPFGCPFVGAQVVSRIFFFVFCKVLHGASFGGWGFPLTWLQEVGCDDHSQGKLGFWKLDEVMIIVLAKIICKFTYLVNHGRCCWLMKWKEAHNYDHHQLAITRFSHPPKKTNINLKWNISIGNQSMLLVFEVATYILGWLVDTCYLA
jgi:hypothetical protein